jgi:hypothetical protein
LAKPGDNISRDETPRNVKVQGLNVMILVMPAEKLKV